MTTEPAFLYHNWANPGNKFALKVGSPYKPDQADNLHLRFIRRYDLPVQATDTVSDLISQYAGEVDGLKTKIEAAIKKTQISK